MKLDPSSRPWRVALFVATLALCLAHPGGVQAQNPPAEFVILVSVDGLLPDFYLDETWPAPFLQRMAASGISVQAVEGVFPSLTYPSHTSIATGALPIRHGVFYNSPFEPGGPTGRWYWDFDSVRTTTIWEAARGAGLKTASIHWPVTLGAPIDFNIPEAWPLDRSMSRTVYLRNVSTPPGILEELEREAMGRLVDYDAKGATERWRYRFLDTRAVDMANYLLSVHRPNLLTLHLLGVDDAMHGGTRTQATREAVATVDALIGYLWHTVETLGISDRTALIVAGDHGFVAVDTLLAPNVWLVDAGLRGAKPGEGVWRASFHAKGGSAFLHLIDRSDKEALEIVREIMDALEPSVRSRFDVLPRIELLQLGADTTAALALAAMPGTAFSETTTQAVLQGEGATHGHLPTVSNDIYTGLVAMGAGVANETALERIRITDIAPLIAYLLGFDLASTDGSLPGELIARPSAID